MTMNLDDIYTPIDEAKEEIWKRWEDKELKKKVNNFLGANLPHFLIDSPKAYIARHVATPNFELLRFFDLTDKINMEFVLSEYLDDKFVTENICKYHLGKILFSDNTKDEKRPDKPSSAKSIIDFNKSNGKRILELKTVDGENLVEFHHKLLNDYRKQNCTIHDFSKWIKSKGESPEEFYIFFLSFFVRNGILFENFLLNKEEKNITQNVIIPAFQVIKNIFGIKPLVVRLLPKESEDNLYWYSYPKKQKNEL